MVDVLSPELLPYVLTATAMLMLAGWLVWLDIGSRVNQVFALLLVMRGLTFVVGAVWIAYGFGMEAPAITAFYLGPYLIIPLAPLVIYFLSIYPRRRGVFGTTRWGPWALLAATVLFESLYLLNHGVYRQLTLVDGAPVGAVDGPLIAFAGIRLPMFGLAALILARDYARNPHGSQGFSLFLVSAGFALNALVDGVLSVEHFASNWSGWGAWDLYTWLFRGLPLLVIPLGLASLYYFARTLAREKDDARLNEPRRFLVYLVPAAVISAGVAAFLRYHEMATGTGDFIHGFWRLLVPFLITYALLRYSLFSIDIKMKAGVRRGIIVAAFTVTFFLVTEAAEALIAEGRGAVFGFASAVALALAAQPLQRGARRAADALMPDVKPIEEMNVAERKRMYHEQYLLVEHDGELTTKERRMLDNLAEALGLSAMEAARLETKQIDIETDEDVAPRVVEEEASRGRRVYRSVVLATMTGLVFASVGTFLEIVVDAGSFTAGLVAAAIISLLLGPLERLAGRMTDKRTDDDVSEDNLHIYQQELEAALADGDWSRRDRTYMQSLAERLGIDRKTRRGLDQQALEDHGLR